LEPQPIGVPAPRPSLHSEPYWDACRREELTFLRCDTCETVSPLPSLVCGQCLNDTLTWTASSGRGELYSWTVVWRPQHPTFVVPYAPAIVHVEEDWFHIAAVIGCEPEDLRDGMPLAVEFHPVSDDIVLPYWRPADA
jgi:uncharacterized OB-fold protein